MQLPLATVRIPRVLAHRVPRQTVAASLVLLFGIALAVVMSATEGRLAPLWLLGMAAGFVLQRSRFCFASAFRDFFLFGSSRIMRGILAGLAVATVGFALVQFNEVPFPSFGAQPQEAHILPVGLSTVIAGLLFGVGMVVAGGCTSGSLYRMAEGYVASAVAVLGIIVGLGILMLQWNWWWDTLLIREPRVWLPSILNLGYGGAVALTLAGLLATFLLLLWWESRTGLAMQRPAAAEPGGTFSEQLRALWRGVFVTGWSPVVGGVTLGGLVVLMYMVHMPWGVTGELARWATNGMAVGGVELGELRGLSAIGGCAAQAVESGFFGHAFAMTVGLIAGSLVAALFAGEFKMRFPPRRRRYVQAIGGGVAMGYGAGLGIGCTVGAFFSAVPSLSVSGWLFAVSLFGGAYLGVQVIRRIP